MFKQQVLQRVISANVTALLGYESANKRWTKNIQANNGTKKGKEKQTITVKSKNTQFKRREVKKKQE